MKYFVIFLVLSGFVGIAFAEHGELHPEPTPICPEGTILKGDVCVKAEPLCGKGDVCVKVEPLCGEGTAYQDGICIVIEKDENTNSSGKWGQGLRNYTITPPLKQLYSAISPDEVICKAGLVLVQKYTGLAACVTSETREKLIQRNWAVDFTMKYIIDERYWSKTYLVHHTMCAHIGVWEQSKEKMKDRYVWEMTDADLEKIPIIKSMLEYNSRGLYSSSEYPITSTVVSDEIQNQYRHDFDDIASSKSGTNNGDAFLYNGKYYDTNFSIC